MTNPTANRTRRHRVAIGFRESGGAVSTTRHLGALAAAVSGGAGLLATVPGLPAWLTGTLLASFLLIGPGAALYAWFPLPRPVAQLVTPTFGVTIVTLYGTVATQWRGWAPTVSLVVLATVVVVAGGVHLTVFRRPSNRRGGRRAGRHAGGVHGRRVLTAPRILIAVAVCGAAATMPSLKAAPATVFGLLFAAGPWYALTVGTTIVAVVLAIRRGNTVDAIVALFAYITVVRLPVTVLTAMPVYSWTYKHLGVVDYIAVHGTVARGVDIYSGWPGFFAFIAWFTRLSGVSALTVAHWFPYVYHLLLAAAVFALARAFRARIRVALSAAFIAESVNWVGQDYLSPQAFAFLLAVVVLALLRHSTNSSIVNPSIAAWAAVPLFLAVVVSHQLTPYWVVLVALALGVTGHIRPRYFGAVLAALAGGYLLLNLDVLGSSVLFSQFDPLANAETARAGAGSPGEALTSMTSRIATVMLWGGAMVTAVGRFLRVRSLRTDSAAAAAMAFAPFLLLGAQDYGGEALFRVFLYSIPGCAVLVAPLLVAGRRRAWATIVASTAALAVGLASLQSSYGAWFANVVPRDSYDAAVVAYRVNDPPVFFLGIAPAGVGRQEAKYVDFARQNSVFDSSLTNLPGWVGESFATSAKLDALTDDLLRYGVPSTLFVTRQMENASDYYGLYQTGAIPRFVEQLRHDPRWATVADMSTLHVFRLRLPA